MKRRTKKVKFYTLNKGNKFWDYAWGGQYHQFVRIDDVEEKDVDVWNAVDIETGDLFHFDLDDVVEIPLDFHIHLW